MANVKPEDRQRVVNIYYAHTDPGRPPSETAVAWVEGRSSAWADSSELAHAEGYAELRERAEAAEAELADLKHAVGVNADTLNALVQERDETRREAHELRADLEALRARAAPPVVVPPLALEWARKTNAHKDRAGPAAQGRMAAAAFLVEIAPQARTVLDAVFDARGGYPLTRKKLRAMLLAAGVDPDKARDNT